MPGRKRSARQRERDHSAEFQAARMRGLRKCWEVQATLPRCGAHARSTGEPCRAYALANGRCRCHGGLVPKGRGAWHKPQRTGAPGLAKWARKEETLAKREVQRQRRVAAMNPERRAAYEKWHRDHPTGYRGAPQQITREFLAELMRGPDAVTNEGSKR